MKSNLPENIERQCWVCHSTFRTAKGSLHLLCHTHQKKWNRFKYIVWPTFYHKWLGLDLADDLYSYWHLNIKERPHYWQDADPTDCPRKWCRYCGKGKNN